MSAVSILADFFNKNKQVMKNSFEAFKRCVYEYYCKHENSPMSKEDFAKSVVDYKERADKYLVYLGYSKKDKEHKKIIYVGTTIQHPMSRWYYHSIHGKDLDFVEYKRFDNENDMLDLEFELIKKHKPSLNKITKRKQNFNVELTEDVLEQRKGDEQWCQCCLKRRVNKGYRYCYWCSK